LAARTRDQSQDGFASTIAVSTIPGAKELSGYTILERWKLLNLLHESPPESGSNFGVGYVALDEKEKVERFVKVVDYRAQLADISQLTAMLQLAKFEVDMHKYCLRMSKVVKMVDHGQLFFRTPEGVEYSFLVLILERGVGDIKGHVDFLPNQSPYWKLWVLRDIGLALTQIERGSLAHNDVKPSNVIRFASDGTKHNIKLGDVGRVVTRTGTGPYDGHEWAGDYRYRPIENLYGWSEPDFQDRHTAADAYMLGTLMCFLFVGVSLTERVVNSLPGQYRPGVYKGGYQQLLDMVRHAWNKVVLEQIRPSFPQEMRDELTDILVGLTDPDPKTRGDAAARRQGTVGLDRVYTKLERLAYRALINEKAWSKAG